jgi:transposase
MLADTLVKRWQDHLPLNRLEGIYARDGLELSRSTMCGWHEQLVPLAQPLVDAMRTDAFEQPYLCTDATGVLVQAKEQCRTGHFFVVVAPGLHVLFEYTRKHDSDAVDTVLAGYHGYLVADAHVVYDHLYGTGDVIEVNCWAHLRRYFFKALGSDPERAKRGLGFIGALFRIERSIKDAPISMYNNSTKGSFVLKKLQCYHCGTFSELLDSSRRVLSYLSVFTRLVGRRLLPRAF